MKKIYFFIVLLFIIIIGGILIINNQQQQSFSAQKEKIISFLNIEQEVKTGALLLDVRTEEEYVSGHIKGATLFPLQKIQTGAVPDVSKDKTIYVYCQSGNRSAQAAKILEEAGYTVVDLGGISEVIAIGGKVI
jgi:rhodanese-related sulfurtransferase